MNILNKHFWIAFAKAAVGSQSFGTMDHSLINRVFGGGQSASGKMVNDVTAMTLSAVWGCQRLLSETIGSLPWSMYERDGKGNAEKAPEHPLSDLLLAPNADMTGAEFREALTLNLCQSGNAYSYIDRTSSRITALYPILSAHVTPKRRANGEVFYAVQQLNGTIKDEPRERIWHIKGFGNTGLIGLSPLGAAREAVGFGLATEEFGSKFFSQGGKPSGVVTVPNFFNPDQRKVARENLQQLMGGMANMHKFALFEGGMKPEPWGNMPLNDMEFLLLRKFSVQEVCRFYRVPPHMVADLDKATFSNIEQQSQEFVNFTLMPYFTRIEASAARWLLSVEDRAKFFLKFNPEGLLRGDSAARAALYPVMLQNGAMSRNEVRALENLNRVEAAGMDDHTVQEQMVPIDKIGALLDSKIKKNETPAPAPGAFGAPSKPPVKDFLGRTVDQNAHVDLNIQPEALKMLADRLVANVLASNVETLAAVKRTEDRVQYAIEDAARAAKDSAEAVERALKENTAKYEEALAESTVFAIDKTKDDVREFIRNSKKPRRLVFDKNGEPIGTEVVDSLH